MATARGDEGRASTLAAARGLFLRGERFDMGTVAEEAGIGRATLYRWFGRRESLLAEVLWSLAADTLAAARAGGGPGPAGFLSVLERFLTGLVTNRPFRAFLSAEPQAALRILMSPETDVQRRMVSAIEDLASELGIVSSADPPLDAGTLAFVIVRVCESFVYADVLAQARPEVDTAVVVVRSLIR